MIVAAQALEIFALRPETSVGREASDFGRLCRAKVLATR